MRRLGIAIAAAYLLFCLGLAALADEVFAISSSPWFYVVAVGLLLPAVLPAWRERLARIGAVVYIAVLVLLPFVSLTPETLPPVLRGHRQRHDSRSRACGTRTSVPSEWPISPSGGTRDDASLWFQLDPNDGAYNAELVIVSMVQERVSAKKYLAD